MDTWRFYRITVILEYKDKPSFPPPFITISHLRSIYLYLKRICPYVYDKTKRSDASGANNDNGGNNDSGGDSDSGKFVIVLYIVLRNIYYILYLF